MFYCRIEALIPFPTSRSHKIILHWGGCIYGWHGLTDLCCKVSHSLFCMFEIAFLTAGMWMFLACVAVFHCTCHRISYYFPHSFCTLAFCRSVSAQSDSPPAWRLTFPVKETYCCFLIPLHPPLHKTMVSIASTEYIHSSEWETAWLGLLASLPTVLPGSPGDLFIPSDSSVFEPADCSCTNITSAACELALDCDCTATF